MGIPSRIYFRVFGVGSASAESDLVSFNQSQISFRLFGSSSVYVGIDITPMTVGTTSSVKLMRCRAVDLAHNYALERKALLWIVSLQYRFISSSFDVVNYSRL